MFDRSVPLLNPVDDWNHVFIPYCTGDLHAGARPNGTRKIMVGWSTIASTIAWKDEKRACA